MRLLVRNIGTAHLPIVGTGVVLRPGVEVDLCEILSGIPQDILARPDIRRWIAARRLQVVERDLQSIAPPGKPEECGDRAVTPGLSTAFLAVQPESPVVLKDFEQMSNRELKAACVTRGIEPPKKKAEMIAVLKGVINAS